MTAVFLLLLAARGPAPATLPELEARVTEQLRRAYERIGRTAPQLDPALSAAARTLALDALASGAPASASAGPDRVAEALSQAGAWDPLPRTWLVRATPLEDGVLAFQRRADLAVEPATHAGVAVVGEPSAGVIAVLVTDRWAELKAFPRRIKLPGTHELCGELRAPLEKPEVFVTLPEGKVEKILRVRTASPGFCAEVPFPAPGRYAVEVLGTGPAGPDVAALFSVDVGELRSPAPGAEALGPVREPATPTEARAAILGRVNALRKAHGALPLVAEARLDAVAQAYAERMAREHFFGHVAPDGDSVSERLRAAGYGYRANGENLGLSGSGPLGAHAALERSPGHRRNLLNSAFTQLGLGIARETVGGQTQTLLVEVLAAPERRSGDPLGDAYRRIAEQRSALGLPELARSPALEVVAAEQARVALDAEDPNTDQLLRPEQLHARIAVSLQGVDSTSADLFVAEDLSELPRSRGLADGRNAWVGVGAVRASAGPTGRAPYWVVVIYAGHR